MTKQGQADSPELRKQVKDRLIQNEILLQEAQRRGVAERAEVKFMLDVQRQNTLIQALLARRDREIADYGCADQGGL